MIMKINYISVLSIVSTGTTCSETHGFFDRYKMIAWFSVCDSDGNFAGVIVGGVWVVVCFQPICVRWKLYLSVGVTLF
jgi:hypothetical protein